MPAVLLNYYGHCWFTQPVDDAVIGRNRLAEEVELCIMNDDIPWGCFLSLTLFAIRRKM